MRDYAKISTSLWRSRKWRAINDDARLLYLYLHTCPHVNSVGCFILPTGYALDDLGWEKERYLNGIETLSKAQLIGFDDGENMVRIVEYLRHDPFANPKHADGAVKIALKLPECVQRELLFNDLRQTKHVVSGRIPLQNDTVSKPYTDGIDIPNPNPSPNPYPEPEPELNAAAALREGEGLTLREKILAACQVDTASGLTGHGGTRLGTPADMAEVSRWLDLPKITEAHILEVVASLRAKMGQSPKSLKYFTAAICELSGQLDAPALAPAAPAKGLAPAASSQKDQLAASVARLTKKGVI